MNKFVLYIIAPLARKLGWKRFCEIGAQYGTATDGLLNLPDISYTVIDPCLELDLDSKYAADARVTVLRSNSLDALPQLHNSYQCILIDGDHNWYTVWNELSLIRQNNLLSAGGMIFFHDVEWPYGRRDMYYQPDTIPPDHRLEFERKGIIQGVSELAASGGKNAYLLNATREGGPKNGVLTAIEDFVAEHPSEYHFCVLRAQFGLGILQRRSKRKSEDFSFLLLRIKASLYGFLGRQAYAHKDGLKWLKGALSKAPSSSRTP